jgi:predicted transposase/invertase (TIGR01784 family)
MDDDFMTKVFEDITCAQLLLRIILGINDLIVISVQTQKNVKNLQGRSVRLDIFAKDSNGNYYNIEIQRDNGGADPKRARYNGSLIDANVVKTVDKKPIIPEVYVIFITENDVLHGNLPIYNIERTITQTGELFDDGLHIVYVNGKIQDETALGKLMHDFSCKNADDMHYKILSERVRYFKEDEEGITDMCKAMEDIRNMGRAEGIAVGEARGLVKGRVEGEATGRIIGTIETCFEDGKSIEYITELIIRKYKLTDDDAKQFVSLYCA